MNFLLQRGRVLIMIFTVMSLASTVFISTAAENYLRFFPAVQGLQAGVSSVTFRPGLSPQLELSVSVHVINSNDYSGITIGGIVVKLLFFSPNETLFNGYMVGGRVLNAPLGPKAHVSASVPVLISPQSLVSNLTSFVKKYPQLVTARILLRVEFITFLDPATGPTVILNEQNVPLSISPPNAIL